jgi:hypothetical protein
VVGQESDYERGMQPEVAGRRKHAEHDWLFMHTFCQIKDCFIPNF